MTPINNSDTAWLITTDFNQENNLPYEELRKDIHNPAINQWHYESSSSQGVGVVDVDVGVGGYVGFGGVGFGGVIGFGGYVGFGGVGFGGVGDVGGNNPY